MTLISEPPRGHSCGPSRAGVWSPYTNDVDGTVRHCTTCGKTFVAFHQEWRPGTRHMYAITLWRPEGRIERWRRNRRAAREERVR